MAAAYGAVGRDPNLVACPICLTEFDRSAAISGELSAEHVPPRSVGGRETCLTCRTCNSDGGRLVDSAVAEFVLNRQLNDAVRSRYTGDDISRAIKLKAGGMVANAILSVDENGVAINVDSQRNDPRNADAIVEHIRRSASSGQPATITVSATFRWGMGSIFAGWLRTGYLAAFSMFGYTLALDHALTPVRNQIMDPRRETLRRSAIAFVSPDGARWEPTVNAVREPINGAMVYLPSRFTGTTGGVAVLLPWPDVSAPGFFDLLAREYIDVEGTRRTDFTVNPIGWPTQPECLIDFAERTSNDGDFVGFGFEE